MTFTVSFTSVGFTFSALYSGVTSSCSRFVYRAVRFFRAGDFSRFDPASQTSQIAGRCGHRPLRGRDVLGRTIENAGYHRLRTRNRPYHTETVPPRVEVDVLIDPGAVYLAVRFFVPVTFSVLAGRAGHPRLRDDVGIVPYAGGMFWACRGD